MKKYGIVSTGMYVPEKKLTNADLEKVVETNDEWIVSRTGIKERRIAGDDMDVSDMAAIAAKNCLSGVGAKPDMIISSTGTAEHATPYHASTVEAKLRFTGIPAFDLNAACSGLVYAITVGGAMLQTEGYKNILVTASEKMSFFTDYKDRSSCILFGDGAASILLSTENYEHEIIAAELGVDPSGNDLIQMGGYKSRFYFWQDGKNVYRFVIPKIAELIDHLKEKCHIGPGDRFYIIPHQANRRMIESVSDKYKIPMEQFVLNMDRYGNTSSASIGLALHEAVEKKLFKKGDYVFLIGFGAGLSWGAAVLRW